MRYYMNRLLPGAGFEEAVERIKDALAAEGFGVLTEIDVQATLKKKLDADVGPYRILGACDPYSAHRALSVEDKIGTLLPCNVIVQQTKDGVEIAAVDPVTSMSAADNPELQAVAEGVRESLQRALAAA